MTNDSIWNGSDLEGAKTSAKTHKIGQDRIVETPVTNAHQ